MHAPDPSMQTSVTSTHGGLETPTPFVSVLIPAHNEEKFIGKCIASVFATGWPADRLEILVIDHQSTDATADVARTAGARVISAGRDKKIGGVRNVGLSAAQGEFVAFVDADCTVPRTWLSSAIDILSSDERVGAVGGGPALAPEDGTWVERCLAPTQGETGIVREAVTLVTYSFIARTELLRGLGNFSETVLSGEDDDMSNRIRKHGLTLIAASDCRVVHHGFASTLPQIVRKEIWHGSNHIEVRSGFDVTLVLTLTFIAASLLALACLAAVLLEPRTTILDGLIASLILQLAPPALFAAKKLKRSRWQWSLAAPMIVVGYAYFLGHAIGVLGNVRRRLVARPS
jgi:cellulose synthase/poly-beta-1,6-N-acetylglucosamine synthase-like glycosyltransferase